MSSCACADKHQTPQSPAQSEETFDRAGIDTLVAEIGNTPDKLIPLLHAIQQRYAYLPAAVLAYLPTITSITPAAITGVSSFYTHFRLQPAGKHHIRVCTGAACHVKGAPRVIDALRRFLKIEAHSDTDAARQFTIEGVACLGCCTLAPVMQIDGVTYGHLSPETVANAVRDFQQQLNAKSSRRAHKNNVIKPGITGAEIRIGQGSCCLAGGAGNVRLAVEDTIAALDLHIPVKNVGCVGMCHRTPLLEIILPGKPPVLYDKVTPEKARRFIRHHFRPATLRGRLTTAYEHVVEKMVSDQTWSNVERYAISVREQTVAEFLGPQKHIALENCGTLDPANIDEYLQHHGFAALQTCLGNYQPEEVIATIERSGLRGRGGGGFPTGRKWALARAASNDRKIIILNGDEGDPGAFMDRMLMESYPYRIIEGILIAAYAIGAREGYLYIRKEYPLAVQRMQHALAVCRQRNIIGKNIFGSGFSIDLQIMEGAGAFVCGEETALIASIEGRRGMPRLRPPFPAEQGLWNLPTLINNVETYAVVPWIIRNGAETFAALGTPDSSGTKVFSLAGRTARGGLIEVPMGITINRIVHEIGGGVADNQTFKAVQIGGPSGGCIPATMGNTPIDFEALKKSGAIMGSGGLVVLDNRDCMVDIARYFLEFTQDQSCGRCTPCRIGTRRMLEILNRLCNGEGKEGDIEKLETLANMIKRSSLCALGQTAPNPVLTTIQYFREEYEAHLQGRCPAGKCTGLIRYFVTENCIGCTRCAQACPVDAITSVPYQRHIIDDKICIHCGMCHSNCPVKAIEII